MTEAAGDARAAGDGGPVERGAGLASGGQTLVGHLRRRVRDRAGEVALRFRAGRRWAPITWGQLGIAADRLAALLLEEGIAPGDAVALWSGGRPEWHIADAAVLSLRARSLVVDPRTGADEAAEILAAARPVAAVVEGDRLAARLEELSGRLPELRRVVVVDGAEAAGAGGRTLAWTRALDRGEEALLRRRADLDRVAGEVRPDDVATLVPCPGAPGRPLLAALTHRNLLAALASLAGVAGAGGDDRVLACLPPAAVAGRLTDEFRGWVTGGATWWGGGGESLTADLREVRPTVVAAGPGLWEALAAELRAGLAAVSGIRGAAQRWSVAQGRALLDAAEQGRRPAGLARRRHALAERLVLSRLRAGAGLDQARLLAACGPAVDAGTLRFLAALGLPVLPAHSRTEATGFVSMVRERRPHLDTVGPAMPGVELDVAGDGEILVGGPTVFAGYTGDPEATGAVLDAAGRLHTGDRGALDPDGCLRLLGPREDEQCASG